MFQFRRFPSYAYFIQRRILEVCSSGFPHSDIHGSSLICSYPWLFAACHVLLRLLMPRHSPCALSCLTYAVTPLSITLVLFENYASTEVLSRNRILVYPTRFSTFFTLLRCSLSRATPLLLSCFVFLCSVLNVQ